MTARVSLAELAGTDIHLHPAEAVAIVAELCRRQTRGELRGVPSAGAIRLSRDGDVYVEGPIPAGSADSVARMAKLLSDILPGFEAGPRLRARGGLRLVIARALGSLDLPPYDSLADYCAALDRFAAADLHACVRGLVQAWEERTRNPRMPRGPLTISDVRRARRATGLTLEDIANVADVPACELRALEWGDLRAWPRTAIGRDRIARYARAAGLDEQIVLSVAWPLIDETQALVVSAPAPTRALEPARPCAVVTIPPPRLARAPAVDYRLWVAWTIAAVALVMFALTTIALVRERALRMPPLPPAAAPVQAVQEAVVPLPVPPLEWPDEAFAGDDPSSAAEVFPVGVAKRHTPVARMQRAPARKVPPAKKSILHREWFRIVFR